MQWCQLLAGEGGLGESDVPGLEGAGGDAEVATQGIHVLDEGLVLGGCGLTDRNSLSHKATPSEIGPRLKESHAQKSCCAALHFD